MARKKIYDILPPSKVQKEKSPPQSRPETKSTKLDWKKITVLKVVILILGIGLIGGVVYGSVKSQAKIEIWPQFDVLSSSLSITADSTAAEVDLSTKTIPAYILEDQVTISQEFSSSGEKETGGKSRGTIRVYNNYSSSPQTFVATTRFMSSSGKVFRTPQRVTIPGKKKEDGEWTPGFKDIQVIADKQGKEYNIGPSTFSIPGLAGSPAYTEFYGKSFKPMTGGAQEKIPYITSEDLDKAKQALEKKLKDKSKAKLQKKVQPDLVVFPETLDHQEVDLSSEIEAGTEVDSFSLEGTLQSRALTFNSLEAKELIKEESYSKISEGKEIRPQSITLEWNPESVNFPSKKDSGNLIVRVDFSVDTYSKIDLKHLSSLIQGKSASKAKEFLESKDPISRASIKLKPFWIRDIPSDNQRVQMELVLD